MIRQLFFSILFFTVSLCLHAAQPDDADRARRAYEGKDYAGAAAAFEALEKQHPGDYCYNLGNCYYRLGDYARAVLHYRRAVRQNPADHDAAFNLELTQSKLADRFDAPSEMFFVTWMRSFISLQSASAWGCTALLLLSCAFLFVLLYVFAQKVWVRKTGFFSALALVVLTVCAWIFAWTEHNRFDGVDEWVVSRPVQTYEAPSFSAKKAREVHEGTLLRLTDETSGNWQQVELPDGTTVWVVRGDAFFKV